MTAWASTEEAVMAVAVRTAHELSDPIRLTVLQLLAHEGPHGVSQLCEILDISQPRLSNHLTKLRSAGLVEVVRSGRHATYQVRDPNIKSVLDALASFSGGALPVPRPEKHGGRMCYDHSSGLLAVLLLDQLLADGGLQVGSPTSSELALGPNAEKNLEKFDIDLKWLQVGRRKLATRCLDRAIRRPHIGGALGAAILDSLQLKKLVLVSESDKEVRINYDRWDDLAALIPGLKGKQSTPSSPSLR